MCMQLFYFLLHWDSWFLVMPWLGYFSTCIIRNSILFNQFLTLQMVRSKEIIHFEKYMFTNYWWSRYQKVRFWYHWIAIALVQRGNTESWIQIPKKSDSGRAVVRGGSAGSGDPVKFQVPGQWPSKFLQLDPVPYLFSFIIPFISLVFSKSFWNKVYYFCFSLFGYFPCSKISTVGSKIFDPVKFQVPDQWPGKILPLDPLKSKC